MRLDEVKPLLVLEFDDSHDCLCGCRTVMTDPEGNGDEDDLYVVCENGEAHPLSDLCDDEGLLEEGIVIATTQPLTWDPKAPANEARVMGELQAIMNSHGDPEHLRKYLNDALFNLAMLRFCLPEHEREAVVEQLINSAYAMAECDQIH